MVFWTLVGPDRERKFYPGMFWRPYDEEETDQQPKCLGLIPPFKGERAREPAASGGGETASREGVGPGPKISSSGTNSCFLTPASEGVNILARKGVLPICTACPI